MQDLKEKYKRPGWDEYFLLIVDAVSQRATCDRGKSGAVITKSNHILSTGYVGTVANTKDCYDSGHLFITMIDKENKSSKHCIRGVHAEQNALAHAARYGISVNGATLYCTMEPCFSCAKLIVASGIIRVVCKYKYHAAHDTRNLLKETNVDLLVMNQQVLEYK